MATEEYQVGYEAGYQDGWNAAQKPFIGLTDEEILSTLDLVAYDTQVFEQAYSIEAKLREKNGEQA